MKTFFTIVALSIVFGGAAQDRTLLRNSVQMTVGRTLYDGFDAVPADAHGLNRLLTLASYDGFVNERLSIGVFGGFTLSSQKRDSVYYAPDPWIEGDFYSTLQRERRFVLGLRLNSYFINTDQLQVFASAGLALGMYREFFRYDEVIYDYDRRSLPLMLDAHIGVNYYWSAHLGATARVGYKLGLIRVGLCYRY